MYWGIKSILRDLLCLQGCFKNSVMGLFRKSKPKGYFEVIKTMHDSFYFVLKNPEKKIIIKSKMYRTFDDCWKGILFVKDNSKSKVWWNWKKDKQHEKKQRNEF